MLEDDGAVLASMDGLTLAWQLGVVVVVVGVGTCDDDKGLMMLTRLHVISTVLVSLGGLSIK